MSAKKDKDLDLSQDVGQKEPHPKLRFDKKYISQMHYEFDPNENVWKLSKNNPVYFNQLSKLVSADTLYWIKKALLPYAEQKSSGGTVRIANELHSLYKFIGPVEITDVALRNYRATLNRRNENKLGALRGFLKKWHKKGYPGITAEAIEYLNNQTFAAPVIGEAVQLLDPTKGPFNDIERQAIYEGLNAAYHKGDISTEDYFAVLLLLSFASRGTQLTKLKIKDFNKVKRPNDEEAFLVRIPRSKQMKTIWRDQFALKEGNKLLWNLFELHSQDIINSVTSAFPSIDKSYLPELPLLPNWDALDGIDSEGKLIEGLHPDLDILHVSDDDFGAFVIDIVKRLNIISERTGKPLKAHARRFRYTIGTNLAREGMSPVGIAEVLDHSTDQYAKVYTQNDAIFSDVISKAVDLHLNPLAQAFAGKIVLSEQDAVNGDDPSKRIRFSDEDNNVNLATCGEEGGCTLRIPIACYTCSLFQPWADAPHNVVLDFCLKERDRIDAITNDDRITEVLDRTIMAIKEVIRNCAIKQQDERNRLEIIRVVK